MHDSFDTSAFKRQFQFLRGGGGGDETSTTTTPLKLRMNLIFQPRDKSSAYAHKNSLLSFAHRQQTPPVTLQVGNDVTIDRPGAVTISKTSRSLEVLYLPFSVPAEGRMCLIGWCHPERDQPHLENQQTMTAYIKSGQFLFEPPAVERLYLGFNGQQMVFEVRLSDSSRKLLAAKRKKVPLAQFEMMIRKSVVKHDIFQYMLATCGDVSITNLLSFDKVENLCDLCCGEGKFRCKGCLGACYCSEEHQKVDWKLHKRWCVLRSGPLNEAIATGCSFS